MRSRAEVTFRLRQEAANLVLLVTQPRFRGTTERSNLLPNGNDAAAAVESTAFAKSISVTARSVLDHNFPILGLQISTDSIIHWRRDYVHEKESGTSYFRRIPYLAFDAVGDHKIIWELNRHQHLVVLAQSFLLTREKNFLAEIVRELESWLEQNPFQRGINWASALEVAFRALSWMWVFHFVGDEFPEAFRDVFLTALYRHGLHLAENLSVYFSPNTHLLGEAVALHALGAVFPSFPGAAKWRETGARVVSEQADFQVKPDGSHFEQSTYYHVYAVDFFVLHYLLAGRPAKLRPVIQRMAEYLQWLLGSAGEISFLGDDDGGRLFHPYGNRHRFGRATLTTCGILFDRPEWIGTSEDIAEQAVWWLGSDAMRYAKAERMRPNGAKLFLDSGAAFLQSGDLFVQMDCGAFGFAGAGHSHSDTLSLLLTFQGERVFIDPGTFTYIGDPAERNWFRGSAAHNTVRIDGVDQAEPLGPFRWASKPEVNVDEWNPTSDGGFVRATCRYRGYTHQRRVRLTAERLVVLDELDGPPGDHVCEQIWQLGPGAKDVSLAFSHETKETESAYSPAYGAKKEGRAITARVSGAFPKRMAMIVRVGGGSEHIGVDEAQQLLGEHVSVGS